MFSATTRMNATAHHNRHEIKVFEEVKSLTNVQQGSLQGAHEFAFEPSPRALLIAPSPLGFPHVLLARPREKTHYQMRSK